MMRNKFKAIYFDLDGTLVDSGLNFSNMKRDLGFPEDCNILEYIETLEDKLEYKRACQIIHEHEQTGAENSTLLPGVNELLKYINDAKIPTGIITRNSCEVAKLTLDMHKLDFEHIITRDNFAAKPAPDSLNYLCELHKINPESAIYIGDYLYDIQTAKNANVQAGLYLNDANHVLKPEADIIIDCYHRFLTSIQG